MRHFRQFIDFKKGVTIMDKKQMVTNYLREQNYKTITGVLQLITVYPDLIDQLGLLQAPRLSERDTRKLLQYINTNPTQLHLLHFTTVANTVGDYGEVKQGTSDEVYKEFISYLITYMYTEPNNGSSVLYCMDYILKEKGTGKKSELLAKGLMKQHIDYLTSVEVYREEIELVVLYYQQEVPDSKLKGDLEQVLRYYSYTGL